jgi:hypothetical protein
MNDNDPLKTLAQFVSHQTAHLSGDERLARTRTIQQGINILMCATILRVARQRAGLSGHEAAVRAGVSIEELRQLELGYGCTYDETTRIIHEYGFYVVPELKPRRDTEVLVSF